MNIRPYSPVDRPACRTILKSNVPEFFMEGGQDWVTMERHRPFSGEGTWNPAQTPTAIGTDRGPDH